MYNDHSLFAPDFWCLGQFLGNKKEIDPGG